MADTNESEKPQWQAINPSERRVLGVLIEKAKTTPDNYPITIASLTAGCNQKSNRAPQMHLDEDDVEIALQQLRRVGVAVEVQGSGRVPKYRHLAYEWFDVKGPEIAVLTELLLRGPQTAGELRSRASRMESFSDMAQLQPVLETLQSKQLVIPLTPPGRGQLFAHNLYPAAEHTELQQHADSNVVQGEAVAKTSSKATNAPSEDSLKELREQFAQLSAEVAQLRQRIEILES